jgi:hypothetical protein
VLVAFSAAAIWNAARYPPGLGYDAVDHISYAHDLVEEGKFPDARGEYYTPPVFYAIAGAAMKVGDAFGLEDPRRVVQGLNAGLAIATALLLLAAARTLWPGRPMAHVAAVGFFAFGALVLKAAAMFHPETLSLFFSTLALLLAVRMIDRRSFRPTEAVALGVALGLAQLVRAWALWTFGVVALTLLVVAMTDAARRRRVLRALAVTVATTVLLTAPWYIHQATRYTNPIFDQPTVAKPLWERRPASFYTDLGAPEVVTEPFRPHFTNRFWPEAYAEGWGDWYGIFAWKAAAGAPDAAERRSLVAQSVVGILPSALAIGGVALLLVGARRRPELLLAGLLPLAALAGLLYFTVSYPTRDGDVIKAMYMLTAVPGWALAFGLAVDQLGARRRWLALTLGVVLAASALVSLRFSTYGLV